NPSWLRLVHTGAARAGRGDRRTGQIQQHRLLNLGESTTEESDDQLSRHHDAIRGVVRYAVAGKSQRRTHCKIQSAAAASKCRASLHLLLRNTYLHTYTPATIRWYRCCCYRSNRKRPLSIGTRFP